jgi:hypothetical protein
MRPRAAAILHELDRHGTNLIIFMSRALCVAAREQKEQKEQQPCA